MSPHLRRLPGAADAARRPGTLQGPTVHPARHSGRALMTALEQRAAVVAEAMTWLGTPWRHRGRVKGAGVDCAQFVIKAYAGAGLIDDFDTGEHPPDWHIHRDEERFLPFVPRFAREIDAAAV